VRRTQFLPLCDHVLHPLSGLAHAEGAEVQVRRNEGRGLWLEVCGCGFGFLESADVS